jgi:hypothetical protein
MADLLSGIIKKLVSPKQEDSKPEPQVVQNTSEPDDTETPRKSGTSSLLDALAKTMSFYKKPNSSMPVGDAKSMSALVTRVERVETRLTGIETVLENINKSFMALIDIQRKQAETDEISNEENSLKNKNKKNISVLGAVKSTVGNELFPLALAAFMTTLLSIKKMLDGFLGGEGAKTFADVLLAKMFTGGKKPPAEKGVSKKSAEPIEEENIGSKPPKEEVKGSVKEGNIREGRPGIRRTGEKGGLSMSGSAVAEEASVAEKAVEKTLAPIKRVAKNIGKKALETLNKLKIFKNMFSKGLSAVGKFGGNLVKIGLVILALYDPLVAALTAGSDEAKWIEVRKKFSKAIGAFLGALIGEVIGKVGGAALGATLGSIIPVIGTAIGAAIGGFAGGLLLSYLGAGLGDYLGELFDMWIFDHKNPIDKLEKDIEDAVKKGSDKAVKSVGNFFTGAVNFLTGKKEPAGQSGQESGTTPTSKPAPAATNTSSGSSQRSGGGSSSSPAAEHAKPGVEATASSRYASGAGSQNSQEVVINGEKRTGGTISWRTNNPGNNVYGPLAKKYGAIGSVLAKDGEPVAIFPTLEQGLNMQMAQWRRPKYNNVSIGQGVHMWTGGNQPPNSPYATSLAKAAGATPDTLVSSLSDAQLKAMVAKQATWEGYKPGKITKADGTSVQAQSQLPTSSSSSSPRSSPSSKSESSGARGGEGCHCATSASSPSLAPPSSQGPGTPSARAIAAAKGPPRPMQKSPQFNIPSPSHPVMMEDSLAVYFNVNEPAFGVANL